MELGKHLSYLLKFHECVVVPRFGGFISNYKPAQYDRAREIFLPPSKEVVFNARITNNDGLLIRCVAESEKCSYGAAEQVVERFVDGVFHSLNSGKTVSFESVGKFHFDRSGTLIFTQAPSYEHIGAYGLQPFSYAMTTTDSSIHAGIKPYRASRTLNKRKEMIKIAAGAALLLSLSLFPLKNNNPSLQSSNVNPIQLLTRTSGVLENDAKRIQSVDLKEIQQTAPYVLVGGSFTHEANASDMQLELVDKGFNSEIIKNKDGLYRVVIDSYFDRQEAINAMRTYRSGHPGSNAWVSTR